MKNQRKKEWKDLLSAMGYLSPALLLFAIFIFYPIIRTVYLSLFIVDRQRNPVIFNGIQNYLDMFQSPDFLTTLSATFLFVLYVVPTTIVISLFLAVLVQGKVRGGSLYKIIFSCTLGVSVAASALIFRFFYNPEIGLFNRILNALNMDGIGWLIDSNWALLAIAIPTIWMNIGFNFIILTGGLQNISEELYEAATIDGAGWWHKFMHITIPQLSPILLFVSMILIINSFQSFAQIDLMTGGGPSGSTNLIVYSIYQDGFVKYDIGMASAQAIFLFVLIITVSFVQFKLGERKVHYQ